MLILRDATNKPQSVRVNCAHYISIVSKLKESMYYVLSKTFKQIVTSKNWNRFPKVLMSELGNSINQRWTTRLGGRGTPPTSRPGTSTTACSSTSPARTSSSRVRLQIFFVFFDPQHCVFSLAR